MMNRLLLFFSLCSIIFSSLDAQTIIRHQFDWDDKAIVYQLGNDQILEQWAFDGAVFDDAAPSHPNWIHRFEVDGLGDLNIDIIDISFENFDKTPFVDDERLSNQIEFHTTVIKEKNGYFAKVACVPFIKEGSQYQRVKSMTIRANLLKKGVKRGGPPFNSVLSDGTIYKISIAQSGMHKLTYSFLKDDLGISDLDNIDPRTIKLYGNGGGLVPYDASADRAEDLVENNIRIIGEEDGSFDSGDYILFYAEGANKWRYDANNDRYREEVNVYDALNYYFIKTGDSDNGKRVSEQVSISNTEMNTNTYDGLFRYEEDNMNVLHEIETTGTGTGQHWYTDFFKFAREKNYPALFNFPGLVASEPVVIYAQMALRANVTSKFFLDINGETLQSSTAARVLIGEPHEINNNLAPTATIFDAISLNGSSIDVTLRYPHPGGVQSSGWLDFIQARARLNLSMLEDELIFRDSRTLTANSATFTLANAGSDIEIWDVTDATAVAQQVSTQNGNEKVFGVATDDQLKTFTAFRTNAELLSVGAIGQIDNQNLHAIENPDMLIIYHPDFMDAALRVVDHRSNHSNLSVAMAPIEQVYNEFSSGRFSPTAIRDFAKFLFEQDGNFQYLLLLGDGSFDSRDIYDFGTNFIPVYEKDNNHEITGYPADDYFAIFYNSNHADPLASDLSISVGRIPAKTAEEANGFVSKMINYETTRSFMGDWRTRLTFLGDDEDQAAHSNDSDEAAELVRSIEPFFNNNKLFLDLFPQESTPAGDRFPRIAEELDRSIFKGTLITTYLGHGGPRGWAQERILDIPAIRNWNNIDKLSLIITATCSFGDFDNSAFVSAAEELVLNPNGGAIAMLTTTRPVFASRNSALTNRSLSALLSQNPDGSWPRIGDVIRTAKNGLSSPSNYNNERKFMLMGDPAQEIALPKYKVVSTSLNGKPLDTAQMDTLSSLEKVTITGKVVDLNGQLLDDFNGLVYPTVYDKRFGANTLRNDPESSPAKTYMVQKNIIFKGKATVENGEFTFSFVVPKDINFDYGQGKISYYAADLEQFVDAAGSEERFIIGGSNPDGIVDDEPPVVEVFMNSDDFIAGGIVDANPILLVKLSDDNGINVTGNSIGHDLEGFLNEDTQNSLLLNDFYEAASDDYTKGEARFPLNKLEAGSYTMRVRAWDVANNMSEGTTEFIVAGDGKIALEHVLNYPNPFTDRTCFQFDSSVAGEDLEVMIQVFTISGRLVKTIHSIIANADGALRQDDCIEWDGLDEYGDQLARGVYLYKVRVRTADGDHLSGESDFEKLVILK